MTGDWSSSPDFKRCGEVGVGLFLFTEKQFRGPKVRKPAFGLSYMLGVAIYKRLLRCLTPGAVRHARHSHG